VATQEGESASARAHIIWTIAFNDCLYPQLFEQVSKPQSANQITAGAA
jgi:hypothetical protein